MLRFFLPVVIGNIIVVIGASLMHIGINLIFGDPFGSTTTNLVALEHAERLER